MGIMEKKMETTTAYWDYIGLDWDNGKYNGHFVII